jgi:small subunit ribosomal protein S3e
MNSSKSFYYPAKTQKTHAFFSRTIDDSGYSGFELTNTLPKPEIIIRVTNTKPLLDDNQRKLRELESLIQKRFDYKQDGIQIKVQRLKQKGLCAAAIWPNQLN